MRNIANLSVLTLLMGGALLTSCTEKAVESEAVDYTQYVNPFIGTEGTGHTFPGACVPFGLIQTSPVTGAVGWDYCSEYVNSDKEIWGFTQEHLNGTGCMDLGDVLVMPVTARENRQNYRSTYNKETETARPGYYSVELDQTGVKAELTATDHVAYHRYTYNKVDSAAVLIDLQHGPAWNENQYHSHVLACEVNKEDDHTISGHIKNSVWVTKDVYFVVSFNKAFSGIQDLALAETEKGNRMVVSFPMKEGEQLEMKIALSSSSVEGAKKNLTAESPAWNFDATVAAANKTWNDYLSRIQVTGTEEQLQNFYTSFYHALIQPNNIADVDGMYTNAKGEVVKADNNVFYSTFSCWDTYRAAHPFYTIVMSDKVDGMISSLISQAEVQGFLPIWGLWGKENYCMVANHAVPIVAEAYHKGFRGFDAERAFAAIKQTQTVSHRLKSDWEQYMKYGYLATDLTAAESVSSTLESVYDDYAAWDMATLMGKTEDAAYFGKRKDFYKNLFDPETKFMRPRLSDGTWKSPFDPAGLAHAEGEGGDYTEGNAWQYTWHVQHDVPGLIELMGGEEAFTSKLDIFFTTELISTISDVSGLIGQYAHGNEPSHHVAYLYAMAGKPARTQELIREIFDTQYSPRPDGLCGNDDCGQMSAWYMLSAMGFYPVNPVSGQYVFGAPQMEKFVLNMPNGKTFTIEAENLSKEHLYVDQIYLNGELYTKNYIDHADIVKGGTLKYVMK
ncbi:MAG: glycoside hydrolase family 92 protein [Bacteroidaceae bacterium]|nr:glycoside hydrolase family 92 protein [Bacteroidaceae bacterium]